MLRLSCSGRVLIDPPMYKGIYVLAHNEYEFRISIFKMADPIW